MTARDTVKGETGLCSVSAAIAPVVISYIVGEFPPDKISGGFALYMLISSAAVIFGPSLGGIIINRWGWRIMMWICVAISAVVFFACLLTNKEKTLQKDRFRILTDLAAFSF